MNKNYRSLNILLFWGGIILYILTAYAQIIIESSEYDVNFGSEVYLYNAEDTLGTGYDVNVGTTGGPQTWTFSFAQFPDGHIDTLTVVEPATTPFAADFPSADHVWYSTVESFDFYQFFDLTTSYLLMPGVALLNDSGQTIHLNEPPEKLFPFPAQMGASWQNTYVNRFGTPGEYEQIDSTSSFSEIDAWGMIVLPSGSFDCLRVFEQTYEYTFTYYGGVLVWSDTSSQISYMWITENTGFLANINSFDDEQNVNFTKSPDVTIRSGVEVAIDDKTEPVVTKFALHQNYPNPFNPKTVISYQLPVISEVELSIYNLLGQKVSTLVSEKQSSGSYKVEWDATGFTSGVYMYKIKTDKGFSKTKKLVLLK